MLSCVHYNRIYNPTGLVVYKTLGLGVSLALVMAPKKTSVLILSVAIHFRIMKGGLRGFVKGVRLISRQLSESDPSLCTPSRTTLCCTMCNVKIVRNRDYSAFMFVLTVV